MKARGVPVPSWIVRNSPMVFPAIRDTQRRTGSGVKAAAGRVAMAISGYLFGKAMSISDQPQSRVGKSMRMFAYVREHLATALIMTVLGVTGWNGYRFYLHTTGGIDFNAAENFHEQFERFAQAINRDQPIDTFYVFLIHESPWKWSDRELAMATPYVSAVYFWTNQGIMNPIEQRQRIPLMALRHMSSTLSGECSGTGYPNAGSDLGVEDWQERSRLIAVCPIMRSNAPVGYIGTTKVDGDPTSLDDRIALVRRYAFRVEQTLYGG